MTDDIEVIEFNGSNGTNENILTKIKKFISQGYRVNLVVNKINSKQEQETSLNHKLSAHKPQLSTNINSRQGSFADGYDYQSQPQSELKTSVKGPSLLCNQLFRASSYQIIPSPESESLTVIEKNENLPKVEIIEDLAVTTEENIQAQLEEIRVNINQSNKFKQSIEKLKEIETKIIGLIGKKDCDKLIQNKNCLLCIQCFCYQSQYYHKIGDLQKASKQRIRYKKQLRCLDKCKRNFKIRDPDTRAKIFMSQAQLKFEMKSYNKSLELYIKAIKIYEKVKWKVEIAIVLQRLAIIYSLFNQNNDAKTLAYRGLELLKQQLPMSDMRIADCYHNLGIVAYMNKETEIAETHLTKALVMKKEHPEEKLSIVESLNFLGVLQHMDGRHKFAIQSFSQALELLEFDKQIVCGQIWNNIALSFLEVGDFLNSKRAFDEALVIFKHFHSEGHPMIHRTERNKFMIRSFSMQLKNQ